MVALTEVPKVKGCVVVGIAGGSAAGKSTFAATLAQTLRDDGLTAEVLGMDRYFKREPLASERPLFVSPSTGQASFNANHPESADNERLAADIQTRRVALDAPQVLIVEGLMALHVPGIRYLLDLRLFLELDADVRALRRLIRTINANQGNTEPTALTAMTSYYQECARVGHALYVEPSRVHADLILRGDADFNRTALLITRLVRGLMDSLQPVGTAN